MKERYLNILLCLVASSMAVACSNLSADAPITVEPIVMADLTLSGTTVDTNDIKSAVGVLQEYSDTAEIAWLELNKAESAMIVGIDRLVKGMLSLKGPVKADELTELQLMLMEVKAHPLRSSYQYNNASLHHYNIYTDSLTNLTLKICNRLKSTHRLSPAMSKLTQSLVQQEDEAKFRRILYNQAAKRYNDYFWEKRSLMLHAGSQIPAKPIRACFGNTIG